MNIELFKKHLNNYMKKFRDDESEKLKEIEERELRRKYYQSWTAEKIKRMSPDDLYEFFSKLWAMLMWGNKRFYVEKLITDNGIEKIRNYLADLIWGDSEIQIRWDDFRKNIKGLGPAMISEILAHVHPNDYIVWNRRAYVAMDYLGAENLPVYNYQINGNVYKELSDIGKQLLEVMKEYIPSADLLMLDYFFWEELQVIDKLTAIKKPGTVEADVKKADKEQSEFIHNEIRDKLAEIGQWLGFITRTEVKVADGSKVDTIWESTIGNLGRIIYVFEVQTKGSLDSLALNLMKSLNNPAVQGVIAVSDQDQLSKLKNHIASLKDFSEKVLYWDYESVLQVYEHLSVVNEHLNKLGLVPEGF